MKPYHVKSDKLSGSRDDKILMRNIKRYYSSTMSRTKRRPNIRSAYFGKQKIFFTHFWKHLYQRSPKQRRIRILFLPCALELIKRSRNAPTIKVNPDNSNEIFYRFYGITKSKEEFYVQIKENVRTNKKEFMSIVKP